MENGQIKPEVFKKLIRLKLNGKTTNAINQSIDKCGKVAGSDECELAGNFVKCLNEENEKLLKN